ncbi:hypothetical protein [Phreatobacter sp.]|uniref:hypothetical protein n=1 Tax=Phreatobacter sp. TaxID=1966341 RepID=UPI003F6F1B11
MAILLKVAAAVVTVAGLVTLYRGTDPSLLTYGYTLMSVGAVFAGAGIVLFGLGEVVGRIEALRLALAGEPLALPAARPAPSMQHAADADDDGLVTPAPVRVEAAPPPPVPAAPVPPTRESMGLRPIGMGAATAVAATGLAVAASRPAAAAAAETAPAQPAAAGETSLDDLLADLRGEPKAAAAPEPSTPEPAPLVADAHATAGEEKAQGQPAAAADPDPEDVPLVADAGPPAGDLKVAGEPAARAEAAEPDPLASLSQALEDLSDEIARGGRPDAPAAAAPPLAAVAPVAAAAPMARIEPVLVESVQPAPVAAPAVVQPPEPEESRLDPEPAALEPPPVEPAPIQPPRDPADELADLIAAEVSKDMKQADRPEPDLAASVSADLDAEPDATPVANAEPDSFLARLRRSMGGGAPKEADKPREEPSLAPAPVAAPVAAPPPLQVAVADMADGDAKAPLNVAALAQPANDDHHLDAEPAGQAELDTPPAPEPVAASIPLSIEEEMERALMGSLADKLDLAPEPVPEAEPAPEPEAEPEPQPEPPAPEPVRSRPTPPLPPLRPVPDPAPISRDPAPRDPAMATLARDFPELGDLLSPKKASPVDPADALIADLKGIFDGGQKAPARTEPGFGTPAPAPPPLRRPVAPLLREGVIAQIPFRLYGDGTIEADLPEGTTHFASLRDFRAHVGG